MLIIRNEQMEVFSKYVVQEFENRMVAHLQEFFPEQIKDVSPEELRQLIRAGIEKAAQYDVVFESDVERFLECMVLLGPDFDTNPDTSWAGEALRASDIDGTEKMDRIDERI